MGQYYDSIIKLKPGITGMWQANGRSDVEFTYRCKLDVYRFVKSYIYLRIIVNKFPTIIIFYYIFTTIHFFNEVDEIRLDIHDLNAVIKIDTIKICIYSFPVKYFTPL